MADRHLVEKALDAIYDHVHDFLDENTELDNEVYELHERLSAREDLIDSLEEHIKELEKELAENVMGQ